MSGDEARCARLPATFLGYPVAIPPARSALRAFTKQHSALDPDRLPDLVDWLIIPSQKLLELTAGSVYHDDIGELTTLRQRLASYPHDVWLYLIAAAWQRFGQEEHLMPRAGFVGDELGASSIGARLARDVALPDDEAGDTHDG